MNILERLKKLLRNHKATFLLKVMKFILVNKNKGFSFYMIDDSIIIKRYKLEDPTCPPASYRLPLSNDTTESDSYYYRNEWFKFQDWYKKSDITKFLNSIRNNNAGD